MKVHRISAITIKIYDMENSCRFYSMIPGFRMVYGGTANDTFTTFEIGEGDKKAYLNLELIAPPKDPERNEASNSTERGGTTTSCRDYQLDDQQERHNAHDKNNSSKSVQPDPIQKRTIESRQACRSDFGRIIFHTENVDDLYQYMKREEFFLRYVVFETEPKDAPWGERFFHIREPNGYQLSFAQPLRK